MKKYSCQNCINLKTRTVTKADITDINRRTLQRAIKQYDLEALGLSFPINFTIFKRINKLGECDILYCSENLHRRTVYINRNNFETIAPEIKPCPKYQ